MIAFIGSGIDEAKGRAKETFQIVEKELAAKTATTEAEMQEMRAHYSSQQKVLELLTARTDHCLKQLETSLKEAADLTSRLGADKLGSAMAELESKLAQEFVSVRS